MDSEIKEKNFFAKNKKILLLLVGFLAIIIIAFVVFIKSTGKDISSNGLNALIYPSVVYDDNIVGSSLPKNSNLNLKIRYYYTGRKKYYFVNSVYSGNTLITSSKCNEVKTGYYTPCNFKMVMDKIKVKTTIYKDSSCKNKAITYSSKVYRLDESDSSPKTKTFTATFNKNGAVKVSSEKLSCNTTGSSCAITAPTITRTGYSIIGWGTSPLSTVAKYKVGEKISLTKNISLYAITKKQSASSKGTITMSKYTDTWKSGTLGNLTVTVSPSTATYTVTSSNTNVMKIYKTNSGYKLSAIGPGTATITAKSSTGATQSYTYTVKGEAYWGYSRLKKGKAKDVQTISGANIYIEKGCTNSVVNSYLADLKELPSYLVKSTDAIYILTKSTFSSVNNGNSTAVGMAHPGSYSVDVVCDKYYIGTLPHEAAHLLDYRYDMVSGAGLISGRKSYVSLYNKYNNTIMRPYAFTNTLEFFAEAYTMYFQKYTAKTNTIDKGGYKNYKYPSELSNLVKNTLDEMSKVNWYK